MSQELFFLDTNVLSEAWKRTPNPAVTKWFQMANWLLPVPVIAELQEGAEAATSPTEKARVNGRLDAWLNAHSVLVVAWDAETSRTWARLRHSDEVRRQPQALWDSLIDAMAVRHGAVVATRNVHDFRHAKTVDPWKFEPESAEQSS
jgi:predicted nucleic acid-binding protein